MSHSSPQGMKYNRSSLLSLENNYRHANGGAKLLTIRKLKSVYLNPVLNSASNDMCAYRLYIDLPDSWREKDNCVGVTEKSSKINARPLKPYLTYHSTSHTIRREI